MTESGKSRITPFLMFEGKAEEAMKFYVSLFESSEIIGITRYGADGPGTEGSVAHAVFSLDGQVLMCTDSTVEHAFTPAMSLYATCESEDEIDGLFEKPSQDGEVLMPLAAYPFSPKFAWLDDTYGVSWQLALAPAG